MRSLLVSLALLCFASPKVAEARTLNGIGGFYCYEILGDASQRLMVGQWAFGYLSAMSALEGQTYANNLLNMKMSTLNPMIYDYCEKNRQDLVSRAVFSVYRSIGGRHYIR